MKLQFPNPDELDLGMRALKAMALADGEMHQAERDLLEAGQAFFGHHTPLDTLEPSTPEALAAGLLDPAKRLQLMAAMIVACMVDGEVNAEEARCLRDFATALEIDDPAIRQVEHIAKGHFLRARLDILRRFWAVEKARQLAAEQGVGVYFKSLLGLLGVRDDKEALARWATLADLPPGSLGRAYHDYIVDNGFDWPGSKGAPPAIIAFHDFAHILSGYGTTPDGEMLIVAFSAGFARHEWLSIFTFVLSQFQLGLPTAPRVPPSRMTLQPERFLRAFQRGAAMNINLNEGWDYWEVIGEPVEDLRRRYNILPESHFVQATATASPPP